MTDNTEQQTDGGNDLKEIISLLPKVVKGRELALQFEKTNRMWYVGHPDLSGDFSIGLYAADEDIEGAALHLLSKFDKESPDAR